MNAFLHAITFFRNNFQDMIWEDCIQKKVIIIVVTIFFLTFVFVNFFAFLTEEAIFSSLRGSSSVSGQKIDFFFSTFYMTSLKKRKVYCMVQV